MISPSRIRSSWQATHKLKKNQKRKAKKKKYNEIKLQNLHYPALWGITGGLNIRKLFMNKIWTTNHKRTRHMQSRAKKHTNWFLISCRVTAHKNRTHTHTYAYIHTSTYTPQINKDKRIKQPYCWTRKWNMLIVKIKFNFKMKFEILKKEQTKIWGKKYSAWCRTSSSARYYFIPSPSSSHLLAVSLTMFCFWKWYIFFENVCNWKRLWPFFSSKWEHLANY